MKKTIFLTAIACCFLFVANAQLTNTKWTGMIKIPTEDGTLQPFGVTWIFSVDTASMIYDNTTMGTEVMIYKLGADNTIQFRKVSGGVPCDTIALLTCTYSIKSDQLSLKMVKDACAARGQADASQPFMRVK